MEVVKLNYNIVFKSIIYSNYLNLYYCIIKNGTNALTKKQFRPSGRKISYLFPEVLT
jgi:hypothetical protein